MDTYYEQPLPAQALKPADLAKHSLVEYYSRTHSAWMPCTITDVNNESGEVTIDMRLTPIPAKDIDKLLRQRTIPSPERLDWLHQCIRNDELDNEGVKIFNRFARPSTSGNYDSFSSTCAREIGEECDALFGISGWLPAITGECFSAERECTLDVWMKVFRKQAMSIHENYGKALKLQGAPCHFQDPRELFTFQEMLGEGAYGTVFLGIDNTTRAKRAVKVLPKKIAYGWQKDNKIHPEIENLCAMDHPHIVKLFEWYDHGDNIFLVMDFCSGGELQKEIRGRRRPFNPFTERFITEVMKQLLSAMTYMHGRGLMHLDIKGENILLTSCKKTMAPAQIADGRTLAPPQELPHVMVIDLGVGFFAVPGSAKAGEGKAPCGTPLTMAPEIWNLEFTPKADVFSMGVVFFTMMSLEYPFIMNARDAVDFMYYWTKKPQAPWEKVGNYSDDAVHLCRDMLTYSRQERPSTSQCMQYAFIRRFGGLGLEDLTNARGYQAKINQIVKFPKRSLLYRSVALAIAQAWPANQFPSVKHIFEHMDTEGYGQLHVDKVATALSSLGVSHEDAIESAAAMALSRRQAVIWTEFVAACVDLGSVELEPDLRRIFDRADRDRDGCLSQEELGGMLAGQHVRGQTVSDIFQDLTGGTQPGVVVDWVTFRNHFRDPSPSRSPEMPEVPGMPARQDPAGAAMAFMNQIGQFWEQIAERWQAPARAEPAQVERQAEGAPGGGARTRDRLKQDLMMLGYQEDRAAQAARRCSSVEAAVEWLLENDFTEL